MLRRLAILTRQPAALSNDLAVIPYQDDAPAFTPVHSFYGDRTLVVNSLHDRPRSEFFHQSCRTKISPKLHLTAHTRESARSPEEPLFMRHLRVFWPLKKEGDRRDSKRNFYRVKLIFFDLQDKNQSMFTALAARRASTVSEITDWTIIRSLAQRSRTGTSVGEKAVLVLKARKR